MMVLLSLHTNDRVMSERGTVDAKSRANVRHSLSGHIRQLHHFAAILRLLGMPGKKKRGLMGADTPDCMRQVIFASCSRPVNALI